MRKKIDQIILSTLAVAKELLQQKRKKEKILAILLDESKKNFKIKFELGNTPIKKKKHRQPIILLQFILDIQNHCKNSNNNKTAHHCLGFMH